jgi:hypothetical protein
MDVDDNNKPTDIQLFLSMTKYFLATFLNVKSVIVVHKATYEWELSLHLYVRLLSQEGADFL